MRRLLSAALLAATFAFPASAAAEEASGEVTQIYGPVIVTHGPKLKQIGSAVDITATGEVRSISSPAVFEACALYVKVWRNHTLIVNNAVHCGGWPSALRAPPYFYFPRGTRVTAQTWFDVRYRYPGGVSNTHRFTSPRAAITTF
jgi:hypothetical protein